MFDKNTSPPLRTSLIVGNNHRLRYVGWAKYDEDRRKKKKGVRKEKKKIVTNSKKQKCKERSKHMDSATSFLHLKLALNHDL